MEREARGENEAGMRLSACVMFVQRSLGDELCDLEEALEKTMAAVVAGAVAAD